MAPVPVLLGRGRPRLCRCSVLCANGRFSTEAEARAILADALGGVRVTLADLLASDEGLDIEFEPERLGLAARTPEL